MRALLEFAAGENLAIAHDTRSAGAEFVGGLLHASPVAEITLLGMVTTPAAAVWARQTDCRRLAVVTSSHTGGPDWLGLKLYRDGGIPIPVSEERALRLACTTGEAHRPTVHGDPRVRVAHDEVVGLYREAMLPYVADLSDVAVHVLPQWLPFLHRIGVPAAVGDGFADPKGEAPRTASGVHVFLDGDADQIVAQVDGRPLSAQAILHAWIMQSSASCVVSADCHPGIIRAVETDGRRIFVTPVGDQFVVEEMLRQGATRGGEPNGHLIDGSLSWSPDALRGASFLSASLDAIAGSNALDLGHERYRVRRSEWQGGFGDRGFTQVASLGVWIQDSNGTRVMLRESIYENSVIIDIFGQLGKGELALRLGADFTNVSARIV